MVPAVCLWYIITAQERIRQVIQDGSVEARAPNYLFGSLIFLNPNDFAILQETSTVWHNADPVAHFALLWLFSRRGIRVHKSYCEALFVFAFGQEIHTTGASLVCEGFILPPSRTTS